MEGKMAQCELPGREPDPNSRIGLELIRLREINAELLATLTELEAALRKDRCDKSVLSDTVVYHLEGNAMYHAINKCRAAIAKASA